MALRFKKMGKRKRGPRKLEDKSYSELKATLDDVFAKYIRKRDSENGWFRCISCYLIKPVSLLHAGHFVKRNHLATRYDEENVNGQCHHCNTFLDGNECNYALGLDDRYGKGTAEKLKAFGSQRIKLDEFWFITKIKEYRNKLKQ